MKQLAAFVKEKRKHAAVHDSQTVEDLLEDSDVGKELYADSAYSGENASKLSISLVLLKTA